MAVEDPLACDGLDCALDVEGFQDSPVAFVLAGALGVGLAAFVGLGSNLLLNTLVVSLPTPHRVPPSGNPLRYSLNL